VRTERGYTLVEILLVAAIVVTMAAFGFAMAQAAHAFAMRSAAGQFDAAVAYARSVAAGSGNGATLVFTSRVDSRGSVLGGFAARLYAGRPNADGPIVAVPMPAVTTEGEIAEASLGHPPFTIFFNGAGQVSGMQGTVSPASEIASDPGCGDGRSSLLFTISDSRATTTRALACPQAVAGPAAPPSPLGQPP
jgi:prepilin-type N-terminal cleavage/methylation domain-containing protein